MAKKYPEYDTWSRMMRRCHDPRNDHYHRYGGRGISVCERWRNSYQEFLADMGNKPTPKHELDRIDNDGNYEPTNCRWATRKEQMRNTSINRFIEHNGTKMCLEDWSIKTGIHRRTIAYRIDSLGWSVDRALTEKDGRKRLSDEQVAEIRSLSSTTKSSELAKRYGVTSANINMIVSGRSRRAG